STRPSTPTGGQRPGAGKSRTTPEASRPRAARALETSYPVKLNSDLECGPVRRISPLIVAINPPATWFKSRSIESRYQGGTTQEARGARREFRWQLDLD